MIPRRRQRTGTPRPTDICPEDGNADSLVSNVQRLLGREIAVVNAPLPVGLSGIWTSTLDREIIMLDAASSELRRRVALCHEVAHMVLGHGDDESSDDAEDELDLGTLSEALPDLDPRLIKQALYRSGCDLGDPALELEAEIYATELFTCLDGARRAQDNRRRNRFN